MKDSKEKENRISNLKNMFDHMNDEEKDEKLETQTDEYDDIEEDEELINFLNENTDDYEIDDNTYQRIAESIFAEDVAERPSIAFQFYIYDLLLRKEGYDAGRQMKNSIYSMAMIFKEEPKTRELHEGFYAMMYTIVKGK